MEIQRMQNIYRERERESSQFKVTEAVNREKSYKEYKI